MAKYLIMNIADLHFGRLPIEQHRMELEQIIELVAFGNIDIVNVCGDLFDTEYKLNNPYAQAAIEWLVDLKHVCQLTNTKVIVLKGTKFHDGEQLDIIKHLEDDTLKIVLEPEIITLFDDIKIGCIPENPVEDLTEKTYKIFEPVFGLDYVDIVIGHGQFSNMIPCGDFEPEIQMKGVPHLDPNYFWNISYGPVFFGHWHVHQEVTEDVFYIGSFNRFSFGEEEPKGFMICLYDTETKEYSTEFVENKKALKYITINIDENDINSEKIQDTLQAIDELTQTSMTRIKIKDHGLGLIKLVKRHFQTNKKVEIAVKKVKTDKKKAEAERIIDAIEEKYSVLWNKSISAYEKIHHFIKIKYGKDISINEIEKILTKYIK